MSGSCPFRYALGVPGTGVHATRIGGFALFDIVGAVILAFATWRLFKGPFWVHLVGWFVAGEILHWVFGTNTAFLRLLGLDRGCL
jgi:hypothetical protein